jgi:nucleolar protein 15
MPGVIKLSRIPYGFFEKEMTEYFGQFGRVQKLKLFRSKKTGNSKGFAYIQFEHDSVAKIAAETMNNYLMFDKLMKCVVIPPAEVLPSMFKKWQQPMVPKLAETIHKRKANSIKDEYHEMRSRGRLYSKLIKRNEECKRLGIEYQFQIPTDPHGKPTSRRQPRKAEVKDEKNGKPKSKNLDESQPSTYSMIVDSSDDEIELKTPPGTVKKRKSSKTDSDDGSLDVSLVKDEPFSSGDDDEIEISSPSPPTKKKSLNSASFIKIPPSEPQPKAPEAKKKLKKKQKASNKTGALGKQMKFRYFNQK